MDHRQWYEETLEPHRLTVYKFLLQRTHNLETAKDLTQDTLVRAYTYTQLYSDEKVQRLVLPGWLLKVAETTHLNTIRKHSLKIEPIEVFEKNESDSIRTPNREENDKSEEPEAAFELKEFRSEIEKIVSGLPARFRKVLVLSILDELSSNEIAKKLNRPVTTVRADISYGKKMLRERIQEDTG